ncbi:MAG: hypothetical protein ABSE42_22590 [Bryobacteraceae bacterium]
MTAVLAVGLAFAGNSTATGLSGPRLGLVFDRAAEDLRPISGIPGAAVTGDPLSVGFLISRAEISPAQDAALVVKARGSAVALVRASGGDWVTASLDGVQPGPDSMAFSPGGSAAALYYAGSRVLILTGLAAAPAIAGDLDVSTLPSPVTAMAINDTGSFALVAAGQAGSVSLYRIAMNSAPSLVASFRSVSSVRLFNAGRQALVTDTLASTVYQVADPAGAAVTQVVASENDGIEGLVAADTDAAGQRVFAAVGSGTIFIFDLSGGPPTTIDCACTPTGLFRLAGSAAFRLTELSGGPMRVLDASNAPRMVTVPPPAQAAALPGGRK